MEDYEYKLYTTAIKTYGEPAQIDMMIEEMSELTKALLKHRRNNDETTCGNTYCDVLEEMADVQIMLDQMYIIFVGNGLREGAVYHTELTGKQQRLKENLDRNSH